jgi:periplasmic divalent cation tolerance protein
MNNMDFFVILSTCPDAETAARIGRTLVESALVACVNIVPGLRSIYRWNDAVQDEPEVLMILKTTGPCLAAAREMLLSLHPYQVPEVVALPVVDGHDAYLRWVSTSTRTPQA